MLGGPGGRSPQVENFWRNCTSKVVFLDVSLTVISKKILLNVAYCWLDPRAVYLKLGFALKEAFLVNVHYLAASCWACFYNEIGSRSPCMRPRCDPPNFGPIERGKKQTAGPSSTLNVESLRVTVPEIWPGQNRGGKKGKLKKKRSELDGKQ